MIYPRSGIYHCDFTVNAQRVRQTLDTRDWKEGTRRERDLMKAAAEGKLALGPTAELARLPVEKALDRFLVEREAAVHVKRLARGMADAKLERSYAKSEVAHAKPVKAFFKGRRLNKLTADDIKAYQSHRICEGRAAKTVNHEAKLLLQLLKAAKLLSRIRDDIELLPLSSEPRQMLVPAEKQRLFETAASKPEWRTAYCAALLTGNTTMRPVELRRLLFQDIDPINRLVTVRRSKTDAGTRIIPLNDEAWSAFAALKQRADALGVYAPEHHIFFRQFPKIDPSQPMSNWRSAWRSLRKEAAKEDKAKGREKMPRLSTLRFYDLRHLCITEMVECGVPEAVVREVAGHIDPAMTKLYSHPRLAARRAAVEVLSVVKMSTQPAPPEGVMSQNHVTRQLTANVEAR